MCPCQTMNVKHALIQTEDGSFLEAPPTKPQESGDDTGAHSARNSARAEGSFSGSLKPYSLLLAFAA